MTTLVRTDAKDHDFLGLVACLDADLAEKDGMEHVFYGQLNKLDDIVYVVVAYEGDRPTGCGAIRELSLGVMEVKRMYTVPENRGKGVATSVLKELESWAMELSSERCVLETGKRQPEAIRLYESNGYKRIPNYGKYAGIDNSICFEKGVKTSL